MKTRDDVVESVRRKLRLGHLALSTEDAYCYWTKRYYDFCLGRKGETSEEKAEAFLTDLAVNGRVSAKTQNQALSALLFLYKSVLAKSLGDINGLRARQPKHERLAPSRDQVRLLRSAVVDRPNNPATLLVDLLYGCGLRVSEPLELRVKDILWSERQLVIRAAKGMKDRRVPIPSACMGPLERQVAHARHVWEQDRANHPTVGVTLPFQLAKKYRSAAFSWAWFWIFPAGGHCADPRTGKQVRYHLLHDSLQRAVRDAAVKVGLDGFITPHVLRHAFATHSREPIESLRVIMGHNSIETTAGYRHPVLDQASNPLDDLVANPLGTS